MRGSDSVVTAIAEGRKAYDGDGEPPRSRTLPAPRLPSWLMAGEPIFLLLSLPAIPGNPLVNRDVRHVKSVHRLIRLRLKGIDSVLSHNETIVTYYDESNFLVPQSDEYQQIHDGIIFVWSIRHVPRPCAASMPL